MAGHSAHVDASTLWGGKESPFQTSYGKLMMWFFLVSDALTFGGLLIAYGFTRHDAQEAWPIGEETFNSMPFLGHGYPLLYVALMTFILIVSSVTMVLGVEAGHRMDKKGVVKWMIATIIGGFFFVGSQAWEWYQAQQAQKTESITEGSGNDIETIIQSFVASPSGQKYKQYDCKTVTRAFVQWAEQNKIPTQVVSLAPPSADFIAKNPRYKGKSGQGDGHIMPIVNGNAIDFTVRQFGVGRPFNNPLVTPTSSLPAVYGKFGYFTDKPEWFLGGKSHWIGALNSIPSEIFNQNFGDELLEQGVAENFADGKVKGKSRPGRVKRSGASCDGSVTDLRSKAKDASGERAKMYHWCANMKSGRAKTESEILEDLKESLKNWILTESKSMKTKETINEKKVGEITTTDFHITVDSHAFDQLVKRKLSPISVDKILKGLNQIKNDILNVEEGYKFWVWNPDLELGLGMRKSMGNNRLLLATMVGSKPYDGSTPIFQIGTVNEDQLNELMYKGYRCTKDCSGHAAGYRWSDDRDITDPNLCPYSNNSFWEGCLAHTDEQE